MHISALLGEGLLYVVALPIFAFQSLEGIQALIEITGEIAKISK